MIWDSFLFFQELDLLEIRLNILYPYVDAFYIVEFDKTFSGQQKDFVLDPELFSRFKKYLDKIIYCPISISSHGNAWDNERDQKQYLIPSCAKDDIVMISDLDEIPNPHKIPFAVSLLDNGTTDSAVFIQRLYYYYLNNQVVDNRWKGTRISKRSYYDNREHAPFEMRFSGQFEIEDGGWHFSYLFGKNPELVLNKIKSFSHQEYNNDNYLPFVMNRIAEGKDLFGRDSMRFQKVEVDESFPEYIQNHLDKLSAFVI